MHRPILSALTVAALAACATQATRPSVTAQAAEPAAAPSATASDDAPRYTAAGELLPPTNYRNWRFLTSGYGMSYGPSATTGPKPHDNVYVNPAAHDHFMATGQWPEQTLFVLEIRASESEGSINHGGQFQTELLAIEAEVKDSKRFEGGWAFFAFDSDGTGPSKPARGLPRTASCYTCHTKNGAVENTFTQFYPTLFQVARAKGTVRADFTGMPPTLGELFQRVSAEGWPAGEQLLGEAATKWPGSRVLQEGTLNQLGYRLLQAGKKPAALAAFEHVTRKYPASANAWDSLSEAYEGAGNVEGARRAVSEALERLVDDKSLDQARRENLQRALEARATRLAATK